MTLAYIVLATFVGGLLSVLIAASLGGLVDTHAAGISVAALAATGRMPARLV